MNEWGAVAVGLLTFGFILERKDFSCNLDSSSFTHLLFLTSSLHLVFWLQLISRAAKNYDSSDTMALVNSRNNSCSNQSIRIKDEPESSPAKRTLTLLSGYQQKGITTTTTYNNNTGMEREKKVTISSPPIRMKNDLKGGGNSLSSNFNKGIRNLDSSQKVPSMSDLLEESSIGKLPFHILLHSQNISFLAFPPSINRFSSSCNLLATLSISISLSIMNVY